MANPTKVSTKERRIKTPRRIRRSAICPMPGKIDKSVEIIFLDFVILVSIP
jgi:hypothetical protein